jgi:phospholipid/cholesterol/gamma-HCH transport system substrate-binding protein
VLIGLIAMFAFVIWLARSQGQTDTHTYRIYVEGSAEGLGIGGDVRYRGIRVGAISHIEIDPVDPSRVGVLVDIDADVPIREGDTAQVTQKGITGVTYINIDGASADSAVLTADAEQPFPVIPSAPSDLEQLVKSAPDLLSRGIVLVNRASELLDDQNRRHMARILDHLDQVTAEVAARKGQVGSVLDTLEVTGVELAEGMREFRGLMARAGSTLDEADHTLRSARESFARFDQVADGDVRNMLSSVQSAADSIAELADASNSFLARNGESLTVFASEGLGQFSRFITEARLLVAGLSRLTERLETDGARFLIGDREAEFRPE